LSTTRWKARVGEKCHDVEIARRAGGVVEASVDGRAYRLNLTEPQPLVYSILLGDGTSHEAIVQQRSGISKVRVGGVSFEVIPDEAARAALAERAGRPAASGQAAVRAIMPGRVVRLLVAPGDQVAARQGLLVIEAMKMENEITAPRAGVVGQIMVAPGRPVESGETLLILE